MRGVRGSTELLTRSLKLAVVPDRLELACFYTADQVAGTLYGINDLNSVVFRVFRTSKSIHITDEYGNDFGSMYISYIYIEREIIACMGQPFLQ